MALYLAELSGESIDLSLQELEALVETAGGKLSVKGKLDKGKIALLDISLRDSQVRELAEKSAMLKFIAAVVKELKNLELKELGKVAYKWVKFPFCVRVLDLEGEQLPEIEGRLASVIFDYFVHEDKRQHITVSLNNQKTTVLFVIAKKRVFVTDLVWKSEKGRFTNRDPAKKPAFHPTTLKPKLARTLVNLSRPTKGSTLLDPFCGTGSVLIESAVLGMKPIGIDMDAEMLSGSKRNLKFYKLNAQLMQGNSTQLDNYLKKNSVDAIATDPPYGRSSRIGAKNIKTLYKYFFYSAHGILKPKRYLAALYPDSIDARKLVNRKQWSIVFESDLYVHGGLTRKFLVLRKR